MKSTRHSAHHVSAAKVSVLWRIVRGSGLTSYCFQLGAGGLPWWAVALIVLGACAVFAAAVVGANFIVRSYQRRILGSPPLLHSCIVELLLEAG